MSTKSILVLTLLIGATGCTSFRTTVLSRFSNDSVAPQPTNRKLKGLPVKLKIPSHARVTVYEQQVILANSKTIADKKTEAATAAAVKVALVKSQIKKLSDDITAQQTLIEELQKASAQLATMRNDLPSSDPNFRPKASAIDKSIRANQDQLTKAKLALNKAEASKSELEPALISSLQVAEAEAEVARADAAIQYTLISFDPPQYTVETELQYTDKVFLVDFKRPAGGILDLKEASMDDEQYFSKVQAEVQERTLADISTAIETLTDPVAKLAGTGSTNKAIPTSADTPDGEESSDIHFQKSVIATQRFDIAEIGWEQRLQGFVNEHIGLVTTQPAPVLNLPVELPPAAVISDPMHPVYSELPIDQGFVEP